MKVNPVSRAQPQAEPRRAGALWLGVLGPPLVWLAQFQLRYAFADESRGSAPDPLLLVINVVSLVVVVLMGAVAVREWRRVGASPLDHANLTIARARFMSTLGLMSSGLFSLLIAAQGIADFFFAPGVE